MILLILDLHYTKNLTYCTDHSQSTRPKSASACKTLSSKVQRSVLWFYMVYNITYLRNYRTAITSLGQTGTKFFEPAILPR